jgi:hypothetical protein
LRVPKEGYQATRFKSLTPEGFTAVSYRKIEKKQLPDAPGSDGAHAVAEARLAEAGGRRGDLNVRCRREGADLAAEHDIENLQEARSERDPAHG